MLRSDAAYSLLQLGGFRFSLRLTQQDRQLLQDCRHPGVFCTPLRFPDGQRLAKEGLSFRVASLPLREFRQPTEGGRHRRILRTEEASPNHQRPLETTLGAS